MPTPLPVKVHTRAREKATKHSSSGDTLGVWALSVGFAAIVAASVVYFTNGDSHGAAFVLLCAAALIALMFQSCAVKPLE